MKNKKQKNNKKQQNAIVESLDTKIAKAVYAEKKFQKESLDIFHTNFCLSRLHILVRPNVLQKYLQSRKA